jgi:NUMOD3 motif
VAQRGRSGSGGSLTDLVNQLTQLDGQRHAIVMQIRRLTDGLLGGGSLPTVSAVSTPGGSNRKGGRPKGFKMTEATKAKLRAAWLRRKGATGGGTAPAAKPVGTKSSGGSKKKVMSPEAREKIAAAQRKRWAAYRSGKK